MLLRDRPQGAARRAGGKARADRVPRQARDGRRQGGARGQARALAGRGRDRSSRCSCESRSPEWWRSEEHTSELQSLMRISYAVFCLKKNKKKNNKKDGSYTNRITTRTY